MNIDVLLILDLEGRAHHIGLTAVVVPATSGQQYALGAPDSSTQQSATPELLQRSNSGSKLLPVTMSGQQPEIMQRLVWQCGSFEAYGLA